MATKVKIDGKALGVIRAIKAGESHDVLNCQRYSRLCSMLGRPDLVWSALRQHGKDVVIGEALKRNRETTHAQSS